ncbi:cell cycle checkpoint control protein RAD9B [Denticeps clupeoides]|uniref:cell cycle checkpoint control protein RAD9B n=1 Tax=Denticeps clupeoides TaxID=299321 RepID=UPI0010A50A17|nr:cell cycle checkpoint control protein RAD9B [Denticeps clupeoides]
MKCVIEGSGVKVFGKAVHALSKMGDELWLDPLEKGLALRTVNSAHSGYSCFLFSALFFQHYSFRPDAGQHVKCKLTMKCILPLFRGLATTGRNVNRCEINIDTQDSRAIFQFLCMHGITKTHNLGFQDIEALQAVFPEHLCPNLIKAHPKLLGDIVLHFPPSLEEITLSVSPMRVSVRKYNEDERGCTKAVNTEMSLHPDEFDYFQVGVDSNITFCLKELRGLLAFAESYGLPVSVHFGSSGKPVSFSVEDILLEANMVLATLSDSASSAISQTPAEHSAPDPSLGDVPAQADPRDPGVKADSTSQQIMERVASSQGSPVFVPAVHMRRVLRLQDGTRVTPASSKIRAILFGAVSLNQGAAGPSEVPSLVCASDTEDDIAENEAKLTD